MNTSQPMATGDQQASSIFNLLLGRDLPQLDDLEQTALAAIQHPGSSGDAEGASTPATILQLIVCIRALSETHETMLSAAHTLGLTANASAQDVVNAIHALQVEAAGLRKDKRLLDSGMIMTSDRDEFGERHRTHRRGLDLRAAIKEAIKEHRLGDEEISGGIK